MTDALGPNGTSRPDAGASPSGSPSEPALTGAPTRKPHVLMAIAAYNQVIYTNCFRSILGARDALVKRGIGVTIREFSDPHITRARNEMVAALLAEPQYTHLLMIDADMGFDARTILRMFAFDKDVVGGAYPRRIYDFETLRGVAVDDPKDAVARMLTFVFTPKYRDDRKLDIVKGFARASYVGTGVLLIKRETFEVMRIVLSDHRIVADKKIPEKEMPFLYRFFDAIPNGKDGKYLAEDYAFCERWTGDCGGELWCDVKGTYTHAGPSSFSGAWLDAMNVQGRITMPEPAPVGDAL